MARDHHDHDDHHGAHGGHDGTRDDGHSANVAVAEGETAEMAFADRHGILPSWTLAEVADDIDNLRTWPERRLTFSFPTEESVDYEGNGRAGTLEAFTGAQAAAAREVMALYADIVAVTFVDAGDDVDADIRFYNSTLDGTAGGAPYNPDTGRGGDIWIYGYDPATVDGRDHDTGSYHNHLLVHEMGHVMGLSHTSFADGDDYAERATYLENNHAWSAMSYLTAGSAGLDWGTTYSATPMIADVLALQSIYGANVQTRTGDTTYGFNSTAGRTVFDFSHMLDAHGAVAAVTIWDAGGTDTLDLSGFGADQFVNLSDGTLSSVGGHDLNLGIAQGAVIENAVGGRGDDLILGNDAANALTGGLGADTLEGGPGADSLRGDGVANATPAHGAVRMNGDQAVSFAVDGRDAAGASWDAMTVEMLVSFDTGIGAQWFTDMPGDWYLVFDEGNQGLWYRADEAWTFTGIRSDAVTDGALHRISVVLDEAGDASFYLDGARTGGGSGRAPVLDLTAAETVRFSHDGMLADVRVWDRALARAEIAEGALTVVDADADGLVANVLFDGGSGAGADRAGGAVVSVAPGVAASIRTTASRDDVLRGEAGDDRLWGEDGADELDGGTGDDILRGGAGDDVLWGGAGRDKLWGGRGADTFVFDAADGRDVVRDFEIDRDVIALRGGLTFADVGIAEHGRGARLVMGETRVLLAEIDAGALTADHFVWDWGVV